jgi:hypothetical protein
MTELLSCPFCGDTDIAVYPNDVAECGRNMSYPGVDANYGHCDRCGMDGPVMDTEEGAREAWNRRTAPVSAPLDTQALPELPELPQPNHYDTTMRRWAWSEDLVRMAQRDAIIQKTALLSEILPLPVAPKGPFADYSAEEVEAYAREYARSLLK